MSDETPAAPLQPFAERLAAVFVAAGFPRMPARVLITLTTAAEGGLTADALRGRLGVSAAAISGAIRYLEVVGMVRRLPHQRSRREVYEVLEGSGWYTASLRATAVYDAIGAIVPDGVAAAREAGAADVADRLDEMGRFFAFIRTRLPALIEEWEAVRDTPESARAAAD
ncbi:MAG TPA: MarR family transcriptional regulator [Amnibacterium sp.]|jgi:DNA-binding transcriptional regulator GbsR (MarR family)|uniref:GbsR/MarR family transcriptional regulator n=1 Tax=Amnibacterium sp. TaxID=1872496 RepID=UPI002F91E44D